MKKTIALLIILFGMTITAMAVSVHHESLKAENLGDSFESTKIDLSLRQIFSQDEKNISIIISFKKFEKPNVEELKAAGIELKRMYHLINGAHALGSPKAIREICNKKWVDGVYLDGFVALANQSRGSEGLPVVTPAAMINASQLWSQGINGSGVKVAIIDTGINQNHPDLIGKVVGEVNFIETEGTTEDLDGHGTFCAGIIAGSGAASGGKYKGIAPGASLLNIKVLDMDGYGKVSDIIAGIEWAVDNDADIISLSLGKMSFGEVNLPITMAADNAMDAGVVVCVASGNSESRISSPGDGNKVITVGASDSRGHVADFSGSSPVKDGRIKPEVLAPGVDVVSTAIPGMQYVKYIDTFYIEQSGTSIAAPVAAGVAALLIQKDPSLTPAGIKAALAKGARKLNNSLDEEYEIFYQGAGLIQANRSAQILGQDLCGVMPDKWTIGRWAFDPESYNDNPGIYIGADKQQKKIYAMAPGDVDQTTKFVFFTDHERRNLSIKTKGDMAGWIIVTPLSKIIPANGQETFSATITVPNTTMTGIYHGAIVILDDGREIASVPVKLEVARPLKLINGSAKVDGIINKTQWNYYYMDVPVGAHNLTARLSWPGASNLDVILLSPAGEKYTFERVAKKEQVSVIDPMAGLWLTSIHARSITSKENYTLQVNESVLKVDPGSLNMGLVAAGEKKTAKIKLINGGLSINDLSYSSAIANKSTTSFQGEVAKGETWEKSINVEANVSRLSLRLNWKEKDSDLDLKIYDESGDVEESSYGRNKPEILEVYEPPSGKHKISVFGAKVQLGKGKSQPFDLYITSYRMDRDQFVKVSGPSSLESKAIGSIGVVAKVPAQMAGQEERGYLEIKADNESFRIPLVFTVAGASITGISNITFNDSDRDGFINNLSLQVNVSTSIPGMYKVQGAMTDCSGHMIGWLSNFSKIDHSGIVDLVMDGREIWKKGGCKPLKVGDLMLYNLQDELVGRYNASLMIDKSPDDFQAPAAYFNGSFVNLSAVKDGAIGKIAIGVGISVIKSGDYWIWANLRDEDDYTIKNYERALNLSAGNHTILIEFNPERISDLKEKSTLHLRDLTLNFDDEDIDEIRDAWASGEMNFNV
jgi:hypothetical protein